MDKVDKMKMPLALALIMTLFTYLKIVFLYFLSGIPSSFLLVSVRTLLLLLVLYLFLSMISFRERYLLMYFVHTLLAVVIFADILYYKHFHMFPSVNELHLINTLPSIWESVTYLFKFKYLIVFADILVFLLPVLRKRIHLNSLQVNRFKVAALFLLLLSLFTLDMREYFSQTEENLLNKYGILHSQLRKILHSEKSAKSEKNTIDLKQIPGMQIIKPVAAKKYNKLAEGRNVIVIQVEALQDFVLNMRYNGQELTPNLNRLLKQDTIYFNRYYQQIGKGGTSDAEFVTQNSLYPSMDIYAYKKYVKNDFLGLPRILKEKGYSTMAFHAYKPEFWNRNVIYPVLGFDRYISKPDFAHDEVIGWGVSDKSFFRQSSKYLLNTQQPFYAFLITLSSHHPYALPKEYKKIKLEPEHYSTLFGRYLQVINYTDEAIGVFIEDLKKKNLYNNTIIAIYGDHRAIDCNVPLDKRLVTDLLGYNFDYEESLNVPLIIHIPGSNLSEVNTTVGGHIDFLPTMLNLLGIEEKRTKFFGQDLCNPGDSFVASQTVMLKGSFIDNEKIFVMSGDGTFENSRAWNLVTKKPVVLSSCVSGYRRALKEIRESEYILSNNLIGKIPQDMAISTFAMRKAGFLNKLIFLFRTIPYYL